MGRDASPSAPVTMPAQIKVNGSTTDNEDGTSGQTLQLERLDYVDMTPAKRANSMEGFDPEYTDIVNYIVRCTHRIWEERDIGLIYTHYTHNIVMYHTLGTIYEREAVVQDTIQRLVTFPELRVACYSDSGRHTQHGQYGPPADCTFTSRTIADCMVYRNRIYREWVVADHMAIVEQLGVDPQVVAAKKAKALFAQGLTGIDIGESGRLPGQLPPRAEADLSIANNEIEGTTLKWLHEVFNHRMFGHIRKYYAPNCTYHGPKMTDLYGPAAVSHQYLGLLGSIPDAAFMAHHICSNSCVEGGVKVAVRWTIEGHHLGFGILNALGDPTGQRLHILGATHYHYKEGKIVEEWNVYDELALLVQIKLGQMVKGLLV